MSNVLYPYLLGKHARYENSKKKKAKKWQKFRKTVKLLVAVRYFDQCVGDPYTEVLTYVILSP